MYTTATLNISESDVRLCDFHLRKRTKQAGSCESQEMLTYEYGECKDGRRRFYNKMDVALDRFMFWRPGVHISTQTSLLCFNLRLQEYCGMEP
jgi:hypothetical protein